MEGTKIFQEGNIYSFTDWFTGGQAKYRVAKRANGKIEFGVEDYEIDGIHNRTEEFDILATVNGNEYVTVYEYHGEEARIYA